MVDRVNFDYLVDKAMTDQEYLHMRPVIEKELLHYDILYALDQAGLLDQMTFQGGTALRLCYGLQRLSEDLDFAGGTDFVTADLISMKSCLENYLGERYGLEVMVKEPKEMRQDPVYASIKVDKWQICITTSPERKDIPKQKIKLEVANIPAYTAVPRSLQKNYDFLPDGYQDTLVMTESLQEIMADKVVSFVNTDKYIRYRDIWDLRWLKQQGVVPDQYLIGQKLNDYQVDHFIQKLSDRMEALPAICAEKAFVDEMKRFIPAAVQERTIDKAKFLLFLGVEVADILGIVKSQL